MPTVACAAFSNLAARDGIVVASMRYGILSDTHANIEALEAVLKAYESEKIDKFICLGDTVGYGASPNEACNLMRSLVAQAVLGNHDAAVAGRMDYSYYYYAARQVLDKHAADFSMRRTWSG